MSAEPIAIHHAAPLSRSDELLQKNSGSFLLPEFLKRVLLREIVSSSETLYLITIGKGAWLRKTKRETTMKLVYKQGNTLVQMHMSTIRSVLYLYVVIFCCPHNSLVSARPKIAKICLKSGGLLAEPQF